MSESIAHSAIVDPPDQSLSVIESVRAAPDGMIWNALQAGAHVRSAHNVMAENFALQKTLRDTTWRAVVLVAYEKSAVCVAQVIAQTFRNKVYCPITIVDAPPRWINALDLVIILSDSPVSEKMHTVVASLSRSAAQIFLSCQSPSPLAELAQNYRHMYVPETIYQPVSAVQEIFTFHKHFALCCLLCQELFYPSDIDTINLVDMAEMLDQVAQTCHPNHSVDTNRGVELFTQMRNYRPVWVSTHDAFRPVAEYAQYLFALMGRRGSESLSPSELFQQNMLLPERQEQHADIFYDPDLDPPRPEPRRLILLGYGPEREKAEVVLEQLGSVWFFTVSETVFSPQIGPQSASLSKLLTEISLEVLIIQATSVYEHAAAMTGVS